MRQGQIHGLVGQNGAGKSTLVKILDGVHRPDSGRLELDGRPLVLASPSAARKAGIAMVFQEFSLVPTLSVAQNVYLVHEPRVGGAFIDDGRAERMTRDVLEGLGVAIDPRALVGSLTVGAQQLVEIAKAMSKAPSILILDEPTASLSQSEVDTLFGALSSLRERGISIVYISHHLGEVLAICDAITVLRDGRVQFTGSAAGLDIDRLVTAITGTAPGERTDVEAAGRPPIRQGRPPALEIRGWRLRQRLSKVDVAIFPGEVVGVAGLLGSGRSTLLRSIVGLEPDVTGLLLIGGRERRVRSPADALRHGLAFVPEDRRRQGVVVGQTVQANLLLSVWDRLMRHFLIDESRAVESAAELIARLGVLTPSQTQLIERLSGGNQQKVVVGRSLARGPDVLLLDDPTAGIDIGSRRDLLAQVRAFADAGGAVLIVSSELGDLGRIADRVLVMARGAIRQVLDRSAGDVLSEANILSTIHRDDGRSSPRVA